VATDHLATPESQLSLRSSDSEGCMYIFVFANHYKILGKLRHFATSNRTLQIDKISARCILKIKRGLNLVRCILKIKRGLNLDADKQFPAVAWTIFKHATRLGSRAWVYIAEVFFNLRVR